LYPPHPCLSNRVPVRQYTEMGPPMVGCPNHMQTILLRVVPSRVYFTASA